MSCPVVLCAPYCCCCSPLVHENSDILLHPTTSLSEDITRSISKWKPCFSFFLCPSISHTSLIILVIVICIPSSAQTWSHKYAPVYKAVKPDNEIGSYWKRWRKRKQGGKGMLVKASIPITSKRNKKNSELDGWEKGRLSEPELSDSRWLSPGK